MNSNKIKTSYTRKGISDPRATVVFIHGFPFTKELWKWQVAAFPEGIETVSYDIRGCGESEAGHGFFSIDLFASDLLDLIEGLGLKKVVLCGISMGGYIALRAYERSQESFSGLVLCDTNAAADTNEAKLNRFASIEKIQNGGKEAFADGFIQRVLSNSTFEKNPDVADFIRRLILSLPCSTLCSCQLALASRTDTGHVLENITVPTLIIRGEEDILMPQQQALNLHSAIKNSVLAEIPLSGHLPNVENPGAFNEVLNDFLVRNYFG